MSREPTVGEFVAHLEEVAPARVAIGAGLSAFYHLTVEIDDDTGEWTVVKHVGDCGCFRQRRYS